MRRGCLAPVLAVAVSAACCGCTPLSQRIASRAEEPGEGRQASSLHRYPFTVFSSKDASEAELTRAVQALGDVSEPASFWSSMANDTDFPTHVRRHCAMQLFRRHVRRNMSLARLAEALGKPSWVSKKSLASGPMPGGKVVVRGKGDRHGLAIALFPEGERERWAVLLILSDPAETGAVLKLVKGEPTDKRVASVFIDHVVLFGPKAVTGEPTE